MKTLRLVRGENMKNEPKSFHFAFLFFFLSYSARASANSCQAALWPYPSAANCGSNSLRIDPSTFRILSSPSSPQSPLLERALTRFQALIFNAALRLEAPHGFQTGGLGILKSLNVWVPSSFSFFLPFFFLSNLTGELTAPHTRIGRCLCKWFTRPLRCGDSDLVQ